jgi:phosphoribosylamine---glycine ligase
MAVDVLVVGGGGREHAITWKLAQSSRIGQLYVAPGNAGTAQLAQNLAIGAEDIPAVVQAAQDHAVDLVVVGPEAPLAAGLVDALQAVGIPAFGPTQAAAQLEASKAFSKAFMQAHNIPTAAYGEFDRYDDALAYVESVSHPVVVKADGLAAGKGVIVCDDVAQARDALKLMMQDGAFGAAGGKVIVEERLTGLEVSVLAFSDGQNVALMPPTRDHKQVFDNDEGPNTGGMGAFGPVPDVDLTAFQADVIEPTVRGMAAAGSPYVGVLYAGLMLTPDGLRVLEFNCRFGDPETQVVLPLLESDLLDIMLACVDGRLEQTAIQWQAGAAATVVAASSGYPGAYPKGLSITGLDAVQDAVVFHAGVKLDGEACVTSGGRVLTVSATGATLDAALTTAYAQLGHIHFEGMHYRRDIGHSVTA